MMASQAAGRRDRGVAQVVAHGRQLGPARQCMCRMFFLLPRILCLQRAKDLVFSSREVDAEEALRPGILFRIVEQESLMHKALAERYHHASTEALGIAKNILNRSFNLDQDTLVELEASAQALALHTAYHDEAVANFLNKRPLTFQGDAKP